MFLTLEDPRARIKGSRDPLGVQPLWASFGRRAVVNLTTVTTSVRGFTVLLLGRWWCEQLLENGKIGEEDVLPAFLRWEQVSAHVRRAKGGKDEGRILGIERVDRFAREGRGRVQIEDGPDGRILSDQKTYGLWGLYSVAARTSGLLAEGPVGLTATARDHVEGHLLPRIGSVQRKLEQLVRKGGRLDVREGKEIVVCLGEVLDEQFDDVERDFYGRSLRDAEFADVGSEEVGRQARLRELLERYTDLDWTFNRGELERILPGAEDLDSGLALALRRIGTLEALLAPAEKLFGHLQARRGQGPADVAAEIQGRWGRDVPHLDGTKFRELRGAVESLAGPEVWVQIERVYQSFLNADYEEAVLGLLAWNELVMRGRGAAAWVRLGDDGLLDVRYRGTENELPHGSELPELWRNSYFIPSLKTVARQLQEASE